MQKTKIQLLPVEMELMCNADFILTKNALLQKLKHFLEDLQLEQKNIIEKTDAGIPEEVLKISHKVSRGENYRGFPWLILDHPRYFEINNIFAIRTLFWWGNFFSITMHLSGRYKEMYQSKIIGNIPSLIQNEFFMCNDQREWEHHFESENYKKSNEYNRIELEDAIRNKPFLKIAKKIPLNEFENSEELLNKIYEEIINLLN